MYSIDNFLSLLYVSFFIQKRSQKKPKKKIATFIHNKQKLFILKVTIFFTQANLNNSLLVIYMYIFNKILIEILII